MATLASLVVKLTGDIGGFTSAMDNASGKLRATGASMRSVGAGLTAGVTLPLVGIGVAALHVAGEFEQSMAMMQAVSGATAEEMAAVSAAAIALGSDLELPGTSASDAGAAMVELSKAGLSVQESMDAARGVLQLSAAAQIGNAQAATITAQALNTFGLAGTEAARVANLLAGGANASSAEITDMAAALQMSGSVAASMGMPIEHLTTAIGLMANAGIVGSDAGTSLKTMLMRLGAPTQEATALMRSLGISVFDSAGNMLPMPAIIGQFTSALSGMSTEQRNAALATLFGADAIRAANVVLMGGTGAWTAMEAAVTAEGQAQALAAAQTAGFQGALDGLRSVVETVLLTVGTPFLTMLTGWVQWLASLLERITAIDPGLLNMIVAVGLVAAAIGPLLMALGSLASGLGIVAGAIGFLLSPIGLVIAAVVALAVAVVNHFGGVQETIAAAVGFVQSILSGLAAFIDAHGAEIAAFVQTAWGMIQSIISSVMASVQQIVTAIFTAVAGFIDAHGAEIAAFIQTAWGMIQSIIQTALEIIQATVVPALAAVAGFISAHTAEIQGIIEFAWNAIKTTVTVVLSAIQGILQAALAVIRGDWSGALEALRTAATTIFSAIKAYIGPLMANLASTIGSALARIRDHFQEKLNAAKARAIAAFTGIVTGLVGKATQLRDRVAALITGLRDRIFGILDGLTGGVFSRGAAFVQRFADGVMSALSAAIDRARQLAQALRDLLPGSDAKTGPLSDLAASGSALPATLAEGIGRGASSAVGAAAGMAAQVQDALGGMAAQVALSVPGDEQAPALGTELGMGWMDALIKAIAARLPELRAMVGEALAAGDTSDIMGAAFAAGASWLKSLAEGIRSAMPALLSALEDIADLLPHSPAKAGPLRYAPDWSAYVLGGLDDAGETLARRLGAAMPGGALAPARAAASGATGARGGSQTINVTINNPRGQPSESSLRRELILLSQLGMVGP